MAKGERIYIRVSEDLKRQVERLAESENRTVSNYIENILLEKTRTISEKEKI